EKQKTKPGREIAPRERERLCRWDGVNASFAQVVMRGQKRVEDARKRAYDPRIHPLRKKLLQSGWIAGSKPGNDDVSLGSRAQISLRAEWSTGPCGTARPGVVWQLDLQLACQLAAS